MPLRGRAPLHGCTPCSVPFVDTGRSSLPALDPGPPLGLRSTPRQARRIESWTTRSNPASDKGTTFSPVSQDRSPPIDGEALNRFTVPETFPPVDPRSTESRSFV